MKVNKYLFLVLALTAILAFKLSTAQEGLRDTQLSSGPEVQWIWGEVVSLGQKSGTLLVKYLDYETDTEKQILIDTDDKTTYENATCLTDLKPADTVSVDYTAFADGRNMAQNISLEQSEAVFEEGPEDTRLLRPY